MGRARRLEAPSPGMERGRNGRGGKKMLQARVWKKGEMAEEIAREKAAEKARASARHPKNRRLGKLRYHLYPIEEVPAKEEAEPKAPNPLTQAGVWSSVDAMHKDIKRKF